MRATFVLFVFLRPVDSHSNMNRSLWRAAPGRQRDRGQPFIWRGYSASSSHSFSLQPNKAHLTSYKKHALHQSARTYTCMCGLHACLRTHSAARQCKQALLYQGKSCGAWSISAWCLYLHGHVISSQCSSSDVDLTLHTKQQRRHSHTYCAGTQMQSWTN